MNHFLAVCRCNDGRKGKVHKAEQDAVTGKQIDMVHINSFSVDSRPNRNTHQDKYLFSTYNNRHP